VGKAGRATGRAAARPARSAGPTQHGRQPPWASGRAAERRAAADGPGGGCGLAPGAHWVWDVGVHSFGLPALRRGGGDGFQFASAAGDPPSTRARTHAEQRLAATAACAGAATLDDPRPPAAAPRPPRAVHARMRSQLSPARAPGRPHGQASPSRPRPRCRAAARGAARSERHRHPCRVRKSCVDHPDHGPTSCCLSRIGLKFACRLDMLAAQLAQSQESRRPVAQNSRAWISRQPPHSLGHPHCYRASGRLPARARKHGRSRQPALRVPGL
jgi:hypothetical protein